jgi:hypothetical protein
LFTEVGGTKHHRTNQYQQKSYHLDAEAGSLHLSKVPTGRSTPVSENIANQSYSESDEGQAEAPLLSY